MRCRRRFPPRRFVCLRWTADSFRRLRRGARRCRRSGELVGDSASGRPRSPQRAAHRHGHDDHRHHPHLRRPRRLAGTNGSGTARVGRIGLYGSASYAGRSDRQRDSAARRNGWGVCGGLRDRRRRVSLARRPGSCRLHGGDARWTSCDAGVRRRAASARCLRGSRAARRIGDLRDRRCAGQRAAEPDSDGDPASDRPSAADRHSGGHGTRRVSWRSRGASGWPERRAACERSRQ